MAGLAAGRRDACQYRRLRPVRGDLRLLGRHGRDHRHGGAAANRAPRLRAQAFPWNARRRRHPRHSHSAIGEHDHLRHPDQFVGAEALSRGHTPGAPFGHAVHGGDHHHLADEAWHRRPAYPLQLGRAPSRHRRRSAAHPHLRGGDRIDLWRLGDAYRGGRPRRRRRARDRGLAQTAVGEDADRRRPRPRW